MNILSFLRKVFLPIPEPVFISDSLPEPERAPVEAFAKPEIVQIVVAKVPPSQDLECPACARCHRPAKPCWRIELSGSVTRLCQPCFRMWEHPKGGGDAAVITYEGRPELRDVHH